MRPHAQQVPLVLAAAAAAERKKVVKSICAHAPPPIMRPTGRVRSLCDATCCDAGAGSSRAFACFSSILCARMAIPEHRRRCCRRLCCWRRRRAMVADGPARAHLHQFIHSRHGRRPNIDASRYLRKIQNTVCNCTTRRSRGDKNWRQRMPSKTLFVSGSKITEASTDNPSHTNKFNTL